MTPPLLKHLEELEAVANSECDCNMCSSRYCDLVIEKSRLFDKAVLRLIAALKESIRQRDRCVELLHYDKDYEVDVRANMNTKLEEILKGGERGE